MYQPGDELRYVDWKILGRNDRLYVKQFEEETNLRAIVVLDASPLDGLDRRARRGAPQARLRPPADRGAVARAAAAAGRDRTHHLRRRPSGASFRPRARLSHWHQLLRVLCGARGRRRAPRRSPRFGASWAQLRRRGLVVFVSDLLLDRDLALKALRFLRHRGHQVLVLHIMDPAEVEPHRSGRGALRGSGDPRGGGDPPARLGRRVRRDRRAVICAWRLACRRHDIGYHRVLTRLPFGSVLRQALAPARHPRGMIGFLHPWVLAGLAAAAIPVLLHLLARREPPTVVFPAVRYLDHHDPGESASAQAPALAPPPASYAPDRGARAGGGRARRSRSGAFPVTRPPRSC